MTTQNTNLSTVIKKGDEQKPLTSAQQKSWTAMVLRGTSEIMKKNNVHKIMQAGENEGKKGK